MKPPLFQTLLTRLLTCLVLLGAMHADAETPRAAGDEKTLSPYFFVQGEFTGADALPLKATTVDVKVAGAIADIHIRQVYGNAGQTPLEAIYVFPGSTRAAVYGMEMRIGERVLTATIKERAEARRTYEEARTAGKRTSLLEQQRPNVFQMNVANILPGDTVTVDLRYTELLSPEAGEYAFVFPTVVGPRYSNQPEASAPATEKWVSNPYLAEGEPSPSTFDIKVELVTGIPIQDLRSPSHEVAAQFHEKAHVTVALKDPSSPSNDRDYILNYRLADQKIESGLLLSKGETENFFALMVEPPQRVTPSQIPPREYTFIVDVSGSMSGFPLDTAKGLLKELLGSLKSSDTFNLLQFSGGSKLLFPRAQAATERNIRIACDEIDQTRGGGSTELLPALKKALSLPAGESTSRSFVVITDGYVNCEAEAFDLIRENLNRANLFAFGIGSSVNRHLIEGLARVGQGEPFIITHPGEASGEVKKFARYISTPVLTHLKVETNGFEIAHVEPLSIPDVLAERPVIVFGKWKGEAEGEIVLSGLSGDGEYRRAFRVEDAKQLTDTKALAYLWARARIATLADYVNLGRDSRQQERVKEVTSIGLTYNLLTAYTSFVAVDETPTAASDENAVTVKQPLPLPKGVSNAAISGGGPLPATPEPETWAMMVLLAGIFLVNAWLRRRKACA